MLNNTVLAGLLFQTPNRYPIRLNTALLVIGVRQLCDSVTLEGDNPEKCIHHYAHKSIYTTHNSPPNPRC